MKLNYLTVLSVAKEIAIECNNTLGPPTVGVPCSSLQVIPMSLFRGTRDYLETVCNQANGCYANGWFDGCAVMIRRLLESLIIETFEHHSIAHKVKSPSGDFFYLGELISSTLTEPSWNLTRNSKKAIPKLKDVGDKSAHSRRYNAHRHDIDKISDDLRVVVQELISLASLKRSVK